MRFENIINHINVIQRRHYRLKISLAPYTTPAQASEIRIQRSVDSPTAYKRLISITLSLKTYGASEQFMNGFSLVKNQGQFLSDKDLLEFQALCTFIVHKVQIYHKNMYSQKDNIVVTHIRLANTKSNCQLSH